VTRWRRPYPVDGRTGAAGAFLALGGVITIGTAVGLGIGTVAWSPAYLLLWFVMLVAGRFYLVGLYVSDRGVRIRYMTCTMTLQWPAVTGFDSRPATTVHGPSTSWYSLWVIPHTGEPIEAPLLQATRLGRHEGTFHHRDPCRSASGPIDYPSDTVFGAPTSSARRREPIPGLAATRRGARWPTDDTSRETSPG
jgi:hypothetical protein